MKKLFFLGAALVLFSGLFAQKTIHDPNVEARNVSGFTAIDVSGGIDLFLSQGDEAVAISAKDEKVRSQIVTEVKDGVLKIYCNCRNGFRISVGRSESIKAYVSFKTLKSLSASGGSDVKVEGAIKTTSLKLTLSGGADFQGKVEADDLEIDQSSGSDIDISGTVKNLKIEASSGSDLDGFDLISEYCYIEASSGSDVTITITKEMAGIASSGADIDWKGSATVKKSSASGGGSISHRS